MDLCSMTIRRRVDTYDPSGTMTTRTIEETRTDVPFAAMLAFRRDFPHAFVGYRTQLRIERSGRPATRHRHERRPRQHSVLGGLNLEKPKSQADFSLAGYINREVKA